MANPHRGEVWVADLGTGVGHEQGGRRPVLVVSADVQNAGRSGLVVICPLTSQIAKSARIPIHVRVDPPSGGIRAPSVILCDQVRSISKDRLDASPWGVIDAPTLSRVEAMLRAIL